MNAVRLIEPGQPLEMWNLAVPGIGPEDVLLRVRAAGLHMA